MRRVLVVAALAAASLVPAAQAAPYAKPPKGQDGPNLTHASPGWIYYNRPGATLGQHNADLAACVTLSELNPPTTGVFPAEPNYAYRQGFAAALLAGAADEEIARGYRQGRLQLCMLARGWRVVGLEEDPAVKLKKLKGEAFAAAFAPMVGAEAPTGRILMTFANQAARGDSVKFATPRPADQTSISLRALDPDQRPSPLPEPVRAPMALAVDGTRGSPRPAPGSTESATLVLRLSGDRKFHGGQMLVIADDAGREISLTLPLGGSGPDVEAAATYEVRPGRYHIAGITERMPGLMGASRGQQTMAFCLGAPFFEARAGEVLYLGKFDFKGRLGPDLDLGLARAALAARPAQAAAVAPVAWTNGATTRCGEASWSFALVIPGAPYAEGYAGARLDETPPDAAR